MTYRLLDVFKRYRTTVMPADASAVQVLETQRAFVAGAYEILLFLRDVIGAPDTDEEEGIVILEGIRAECEAFALAQARVAEDEPPPDVHIEIGSIYGAKTRRGLVEMAWNGHSTHFELDRAREIIGMLQQAVESAATDQMLVEFLMTKVGLPWEKATHALLDFREMRQGSRNTVHPS